jgi:hypothetical protein
MPKTFQPLMIQNPLQDLSIYPSLLLYMSAVAPALPTQQPQAAATADPALSTHHS